jgi:RNA polymerase sporulation-specific sigma factor
MGTDGDVVYKKIENGVETELLEMALTKLNHREREIMQLRYGLNGQDEKTQREVADLLGISQSYISRLEKKIIVRLKKEFSKMV